MSIHAVYNRWLHFRPYLYIALLLALIAVPLPPVPHEPAPDLTVTDLPANVTVWAAPQNNGPIRYLIFIRYEVKISIGWKSRTNDLVVLVSNLIIVISMKRNVLLMVYYR